MQELLWKVIIATFIYGYMMGFLLTTNQVLVLYITINISKLYYGDHQDGLFEAEVTMLNSFTLLMFGYLDENFNAQTTLESRRDVWKVIVATFISRVMM